MTHRRGLVVLDDYFPNLTTGFRIAEYNWLLRHGLADEVLTTAEPWQHLAGRYAEAFPDLASRVQRFEPGRLAGKSAAYISFLNNAVYYLPFLEEHNVPLVLQLYPGGGLHIGDAGTDRHLEAIRDSGLLRGVIVTNHRVYRWLLESHPNIGPVALIPGVVIDSEFLAAGPGARTDYPLGVEDPVSLAFVAHKYSADGRDKGFPDFLQIISALADEGINVEGHIIGNFDLNDVPSACQSDRLRFHGLVTATQMKSILTRTHIVVSLNRPGILHEKQFDGFPTASTVSAALCGAAIVATDFFEENRDFIPGRDILIVPDDPVRAAKSILLAIKGGRVPHLARFGLRASRNRYGEKSQLIPRKEAIAQFLA